MIQGLLIQNEIIEETFPLQQKKRVRQYLVRLRSYRRFKKEGHECFELKGGGAVLAQTDVATKQP